jgi:antitoxin PrlF
MPESTLTDRYQTTIPTSVRIALGLTKRDKIRYHVHPSGQVTISRADDREADPILESFLDFLSRDIAANPQALQPLTATFFDRLDALVGDVEVDLDEILPEESDDLDENHDQDEDELACP